MNTRSLMIAFALSACSAPSQQTAAKPRDAPRGTRAQGEAGAPTGAAPDAPAQDDTPSAATVAPSAAPAATGATSSLLRVTTAMPMSGTLDNDVLVTVINAQLGPLNRCVALIRKTDTVVGSLNLRVTVAADGNATTELQSPVNDKAKRCLLAGTQDWRIRGAGQGDAMVLLELTDR